MLALTRMAGESLVIDVGGTLVEVTILKLGTGTNHKGVRVAIEAPREVKVDRAEIFLAKRLAATADEVADAYGRGNALEVLRSRERLSVLV